MKFSININPANEGFISAARKFGQFLGSKSGSKDNGKNKVPFSANSIEDAIDNFNASPKTLYRFTVSSCKYGVKCIWYLGLDSRRPIDQDLRSAITKTYRAANDALPKIRELVAKQLYDTVSKLDDDDQFITEEQARTYSRDAFKNGLVPFCITIDISSSNKIEVNYDLSSVISKDDSVMIKIEDVVNGIIKPTDTVDVYY